MKNNLFLFLLLLLFQLTHSQSNINDIDAKFQTWRQQKEEIAHGNQPKMQTQEEEDGYEKHFERWAHFAKIRSKPNGEIYQHDQLWREYVAFQMNKRDFNPFPFSENIWYSLGPNETPNEAGGVGRINVIRFSPQNPNQIWAGSACGGLWKSKDNGQSWENAGTDKLPSISISDIAIHPQNPDIVYIATGDGAGYELTVGTHTDFWGGTYSAGVFKSIDGGKNWENVGLSFQQIQAEIIHRLIILPQYPDILFAATRNGIFKTRDGGQSWTKVSTAYITDMEFHPSMPNVVYAAGNRNLLISNDLGVSWQNIAQNIFPEGKLSLSVSPDAPNTVYIMSDLGEIYKSTNNGEDFQFVSTAPCVFYAYYSSVLAVSPVNAEHLVVGGIEVAQSFNGGKTWSFCSNYDNIQASNYVHADQHSLVFQPVTNQLWSGNDGGVASTADNGNHWQEHNKGLEIGQFYRIASLENSTKLAYAGLQDNGVMQQKNENWTGVMTAGDGTTCLINAENENEVYAAYQNGRIYKSENGGKKFQELETPSGNWITPFIFAPNTPQTLYYGGKTNVYISENSGKNWAEFSPDLFEEDILEIVIPQKYPNFLYAMSAQNLYRTADKGKTWENIKAKLPVLLANLSDIAVSDYEPNKIWVSFSGFSDYKKVFYSENGGKTWENISGNLPNIPINCIEYQQNSNDVLYIGTDFGVFIRNGKRAQWEYWSNNLPNVIVNDLEILYEKQKIRAATFGRGLWEASLPKTTFGENNAGISFIYPNENVCESHISPVVKLTNEGLDTLQKIDILYYLDSISNSSTYKWKGNLLYGESEELVLPSVLLTSGANKLTIKALNPNLSYDNYLLDNQVERTFIFQQKEIELPSLTNFEDSLNVQYISILNNEIWKKENVPTADNSTYSLCANVYNSSKVNFGSAPISFENLDFSPFKAPLSLSFDLAHVLRYDNSLDTLRVEVSTNCGASWQRIYEKGGTYLATDVSDFQYFKPNENQWRKEVLNLSEFAGKEVVSIRFDISAENGNNFWLDNILIENFDAYNSLSNQQILLYPSVAQSEIFVEIKGDFSEKLTLDIWNNTGQKVDYQEIEMGNERKKLLQLKELSAGVYIFQLKSAKSTLRQKILIMP